MAVSPTLRRHFPDGIFSSDCPSRVVLDHVTSKWGTLVILALAEGDPLRWSELRRRAEGVSETMLAQTLRMLESDGVPNRRPTVEELTEGCNIDETIPGRPIDALRENRGSEAKRRAQAMAF